MPYFITWIGIYHFQLSPLCIGVTPFGKMVPLNSNFVCCKVDGVSGAHYSLSESHSLSQSCGSGLLRLGAQAGDVVAILLPNCPEYCFLLLGATEAGLVATSLNPIYTPGAGRARQHVYIYLLR